MNTDSAFLSFHGISKTFPGVKALQDISFHCRAGEVHALMGENGAGKSTLLKILSGSYQPSGGTIQIRGGRSVSVIPPTRLMLASPSSTGAASGAGDERGGKHLSRSAAAARRAGESQTAALRSGATAKNLGMDIDPDTPLKYLSLGQWQMVEIAGAGAQRQNYRL